MLNVERISHSVPHMLRKLLASEDGSYSSFDRDISKSGTGLALQLAAGEGDTYTVRPIPGELYAEYTRYYQSNWEPPPPVQTLRTGEWTLLLIHEKPKPKFTRREDFGEAVDALPALCFCDHG